MTRMVEFAREHDVLLVHDFAYAELGFDGYEPPSLLQVPGAKDVAVEIYSLTKSFSMAGWRVGFMLGNAEVVAALARLKSYLDYGTFQPIQIASIVAMNEAPDYPREVNEIYLGRRDALVDGLARIGWEIEKPKGTMFVWAPLPEAYEELGSLEFAKMLVQEAKVAVSPGVGFGPGRRGVRAVRAGGERAADRPGAAGDPQGARQARLAHQAAQAERHRGVGDLIDGVVALQQVRLREPLGHADDGLGEHLRVLVRDPALDDAVLDVAHRVGDRDLAVVAHDDREPFLGGGELHEVERAAVLVEPRHRRADPELDAPTGSGSSPIAACWRRRRSWCARGAARRTALPCSGSTSRRRPCRRCRLATMSATEVGW